MISEQNIIYWMILVVGVAIGSVLTLACIWTDVIVPPQTSWLLHGLAILGTIIFTAIPSYMYGELKGYYAAPR